MNTHPNLNVFSKVYTIMMILLITCSGSVGATINNAADAEEKNFADEEDPLGIKFLQLNKVGGIESINRFLKIKADQGLYEIKRLILSGKTPLAYVLSYLPQKMFKDLEEFSPTRFERIALYYSLEQHYGITTVYNHELIGATPATDEIAKHLNIKKGTPMLYLETLAYTYKEKPYEYRQSYCLTDTKRVFREW